MENILQTLQDIDGVNGAFVADATGEVLGYRAHAVYDIELLRQVSKGIVSAVDSIKLIQPDWDAIATQFAEGKLIIRNLGDASNPRSATLTVIADTRLNVSFAGVAIRVAVGKLKALLENGVPSPASSAQFTNTRVHAAVAANAAVGGSNLSGSRPGGADVATSGLSWSGLTGSSSTSSSGVFVADAASSEFLTNCTKALARSVGPMARLYVKEAVRKVSPDRPFSKENSQELVKELVKHFTNPEDAAKFQGLLKKTV